MTCGTCNRWCHGECDSIQTEEDAEKCFEAGYLCQLCRPDNSLPPHLADKMLRDEDEKEQMLARKALHRPPSPPMSPDYPMYYGGYHNTNSYMLDGVMLSERGMQHLKSLTIEKDKRMRKRRMGPDSMFNPLDPNAPSHDNSLEGDDDDDDDIPPPTPGGSGMSGSHKDGEIVKPLPDGSAPEPPEGFTIVVKDNGLMVLRKRRYRDLKKVGIGGFQAKVRTPKGQGKGKGAEEEVDDNDPNKPKRRVAWRPKKNKILVQYPEYIQDAFFGKDFMAKCPEKMEDDDALPSPDKKRIHKEEDGKTVLLNKDALAALEEMKAKEEAERKEREAEEEAKRAAMEAATKAAADKARIAQEELDALTKVADDAGTSEKKGIKEEEKNEDEDLMLPSDLFGDVDIFNIFKGTGNGDDIDIDESALDEAEEVDGNESSDQPTATDVNKELTEGLQEMLGPEFNAKDMEDIFNIAASDTNKDTNEIKTEIKPEDVKTEPTDALAPTDNLNIPVSFGGVEVKQELPSSIPAPDQLMPPPSTPASSQEATMSSTLTPGGMTETNNFQQNNMASTETFSNQMMVPRLSTSVQGQGQAPILGQAPTMSQPSMVSSAGPMPSMSMPNTPMQQQPVSIQQPTISPQVQPGTMSQPPSVMNQQSLQQQQPRMMGMSSAPHLMQQQQGMPGMLQQPIMTSQQQMQSPQHQQQQLQMQQGLPRQQMQPGMQQQQIQSGIQQQMQQPGLMRPQLQQQMNPGMQQQIGQGIQQQQQMRPGFIRQTGPMIGQQQQHVMGQPQQPQLMTQNLMSGQRVVMQHQVMPGGQMVSPGGQVLSGQMMQPGGGPPQQQPQPQQQMPQAAPTPAPTPSSNTAQNNMQKWEADEPLGENATIAMILYANVNHPNLKADYPKWEERIKQIAKIWKNLPNEKRVPFVTKARENRTANRMNRGPVSRFYSLISLVLCQQNI